MTSAKVVAQETNRLRHIFNREPTGLELTEAIIGYDEAAESSVIQALTYSGVYQANVILDVAQATGVPGAVLLLAQHYYYGRDNEAEVAKQVLQERLDAFQAWVDTQRVVPTPSARSIENPFNL